MKLPTDGTTIYNTPFCTFWIDEDGILYSISKKSVEHTCEGRKEHLSIFKTALKGKKKVYSLADFTRLTSLDTKHRNRIKKDASNFSGAVAIVSRSPIGKITGAIYSMLMPPAVLTRFFSNEHKARVWLLKCKSEDEEVRIEEEQYV